MCEKRNRRCHPFDGLHQSSTRSPEKQTSSANRAGQKNHYLEPKSFRSVIVIILKFCGAPRTNTYLNCAYMSYARLIIYALNDNIVV